MTRPVGGIGLEARELHVAHGLEEHPTHHSAIPTKSSATSPDGSPGTWAACTGSETIHISTPWSPNTR